jgi:glycine dehydrogenase subunit 1
MPGFRYLPHADDDRAGMLQAIGASSMEDLLSAIPRPLRLSGDLDLPAPMPEPELIAHFQELSSRNASAEDHDCFLGAGAYHHSQSTAVDALISRGEFFTSYTPYQPEISQGTLQAIFEFQTLVCQLTGLEVSQASLYQGAMSFVEGMLLASRVQRKRNRLLAAESWHPHYLASLRTYLEYLDLELDTVPVDRETGRVDEKALESKLGDDVAAVGVQSPNFYGVVERLDRLADLAHGAGSLLVGGFSEPYSLGWLKGPGDLGADIAVGEFQAFAGPPSFGGPFVGVLAATEKMVRQLPGRIAGETVDAEGRRGFVLTLSTREQHIRRSKATSNVCTNSGLMMLAATIQLCLLGKQGLRRAARLSRQNAHTALERLERIDGVRRVYSGPVFNEFALELPRPAREVARDLAGQGVLAPVPLDMVDPSRERQGLFAFTELTGATAIERLEAALREVL